MDPLDPPSSLAVTPSGTVQAAPGASLCAELFVQGEEAGLVALGGHPAPAEADAACLYWKSFADAFIAALCHLPDNTDSLSGLEPPDPGRLASLVLDAPPMRGAEYVSPAALTALWERLREWTAARMDSEGGLAGFLAKRAPAWSRVGRVTLHLAENRSDPVTPFAFMASYASGVTTSGRLTQLPLARALKEFAGAKHKAALLKLLTPLHEAAKTCPLMAALVSSGDVFHPLAWSPAEAYAFLKSVPGYDRVGLLVRLPNWWQKRTSRPRVTATVGEKKSSSFGVENLLDFTVRVVVGDRELTGREVAALLASDDGLVEFRGQWVEVDREKIQQALDHLQAIEERGGLSLAEGMRLLAGAPADLAPEGLPREVQEWAFAQPGHALAETLRQLASPQPSKPPKGLKATLRPYQAAGFDWLLFCAKAGFGACLADDMGLGKTIQVLAALLKLREEEPRMAPALLVVPASLLGNWRREAARFAPGLRFKTAHPSGPDAPGGPDAVRETDCVLTTYGMLQRTPWLMEFAWGWVILDEAQAIKNHGSKQSRAVRALKGTARIALTGTPIENNLGDLWALFDFLNPGLLGPAAAFRNFTKRLRENPNTHYGPLRRLVAPYILRRLKTDRAVIADLPEKTEMKVFCGLSPAQARLYARAASELAKALESASGIARRGLVLSYLTRFKQICNHPDQLTKSGAFAPGESAKLVRLSEICAEIASRGERALVFSQFREMLEPIESCLAPVFGRRGLILHGGTPVRARAEMVDRFAAEDGPPFFVISLKAGGTGLNLTAASHVFHFDRWWNPAVENQATDRAFRIGQKRNVLVHKFVTSGTLEEKIDALLEEKGRTAEAILSGGPEKALTEMTDSELLDFVRLDLSKAENSL